jgi:hypothetical protein
MSSITTKLRAGRYMIPVRIVREGNRLFFHFGYNKKLIEEIKVSFEGRKYHGFDTTNPRKLWSVPITQRNLFRLAYLQGKNPYARYDIPSDSGNTEAVALFDKLNHRPLYTHQRDMVIHGLTVRQFIWAAEMGTGKTLAAIVLMELSGLTDWYWVGPKSALRAVQADMRKWDCQITPRFLTYESLKRVIETWPSDQLAPEGVIFDESIRLKTPTAQRSVAGKHLADSMRDDHPSPIIGELSGAPATKSPLDWWHQCEIACPGFLREGTIHEFKKRVGIFTSEESDTGAYQKLVTWKDADGLCIICGKTKEQHQVDEALGLPSDHKYSAGINEVAKLKTRMSGLVLVKLKKDCLDLPDKIYEVIRVTPTAEILNAAKIIVKTSKRAIEALTKCRELSDGFQYRETQCGVELCPLCNGRGIYTVYYDPKEPDFPADPAALERGVRFIYDDDYNVISEEPITYEKREDTCPNCNGEKEVPKYERSVIEVPCPKDDVLLEQLDLHSDIGRLNVYAGFTASVDKIIRIVKQQKWGFIRADGRGWQGFTADGKLLPNDRLLEAYDDVNNNTTGRLAFVGQPGAAGMGLTLTASPTTLFYSNDFNGDSRIQTEDRGHRIGMDRERGGRIVDIVHLPSDQYILDNLQKKKDLLHLSMTGLAHFMENV